MKQSKVLPGFFFVLFVSFLSLFAGTFIGATFFVPQGSGLAGPAIALGYGVVGLVIGLVGSVILVRKLDRPQLRVALLIAGVATLLVGALLTYRFVSNRSSQDTASEPTVTVMAFFSGEPEKNHSIEIHRRSSAQPRAA